jgi:hypothetical protein
MEHELARLKLERRVDDLEAVIAQLAEGLKESSKLLARSNPKPSRLAIPHERKLQLAADQGWRCADPDGTCPLYLLGDGRFVSDMLPFEADHVEPWCRSYRNAGNIAIMCVACHNAKSRRERREMLDSPRDEGGCTEASAVLQRSPSI